MWDIMLYGLKHYYVVLYSNKEKQWEIYSGENIVGVKLPSHIVALVAF